MNFFAHSTAAQRYARYRPFIHPTAIVKVIKFLGLREPLDEALDVACGTGQSTLALKPVARHIVATDVSKAMIEQAPRDAQIEYIEAPAERLPFADQRFDLVTCCMGLHWFDRDRFLAEAHRVLKPLGWLVIYMSWFRGEMIGNPSYKTWNDEHYVNRFRTPPRNTMPLMTEDARRAGFVDAGTESFSNEISFTPEQLVGYLLTQSNTIAAIEQGGQNIEAVGQWLLDGVRPFFRSNESATFPFGGNIRYLQRE
jgi:ubiquinone/menaquinone biosynthesis C-methylase UbiE